MDDLLMRFTIELKNRNYSRNTIKVYEPHIRNFIDYSNKNPSKLPEERIPLFLDAYKTTYEQKRLAASAIKVFYKYVIKKPCPYSLNNSRRRKRLPVILNKGEIMNILSKIENRKHHLMIALLYASGLRVSEVVSLKVKDLDLDALSIHIRDSKHHKDRITVFSVKNLLELQAFIQDRNPESYLFLANEKNKYSIRTVQQIFNKALSKTRINKKASCHSLRHSFATHLTENGVDVKTLQSLLGHKSVKTTMVYIHLADPLMRKVKSPL